MTTLTTRIFAAIIAVGLVLMQALPALACGGLVAPDGDVRLARAATLIAWHDGTEHYLTSFSYQGNEANVGWIVPLPAIPLKIEDGGKWTLQRLDRETHPLPQGVFGPANQSFAASSAQVIEQVQIEALNVTVIKGSGPEVIDWATSNGFALDDDTRGHLLGYARGSAIFMAAKYDTTAAQARHQLQGDGVPLLITMKTAHPWVPLEVLALDGQQVNADLYFLTDQPLNTSDFNAAIGQSSVGSVVPGASGFRVAFQEQMNDSLYQDLATDRNMGWVPRASWLTAMSLDAPSASVTYDLGVSANGIIRLAPFGTPPMAVVDRSVAHDYPAWVPHLPLGAPEITLAIALLVGAGLITYLIVRRTTRNAPGRNPWSVDSDTGLK